MTRADMIRRLAEAAVLAYLSNQALVIPIQTALFLDDLTEAEWVPAVQAAADNAGIPNPGEMEIHVGVQIDERTVRMMDVDGNAILVDLDPDEAITWEDPAA